MFDIIIWLLVLGFIIGFSCCGLIYELVFLKERKIVRQFERDALRGFYQAEAISLQAHDFPIEDLDQSDKDTEYCVHVLIQAGFTYDPLTGDWGREIND